MEQDDVKMESRKNGMILIPIAYSETVSLRKDGPKSTTSYKSTCKLEGGKSFCTSVYIMPKLIPTRFITYLTVEEKWEKSTPVYTYSCNKLDEVDLFTASASLEPKPALEGIVDLSIEDSSTYYEAIEFKRKFTMTHFSETVNIFPKEKIYTYCSIYVYDPCAQSNFITGMALIPAKKVLPSTAEDENSYDVSSLNSDAAENCYSEDTISNSDCDSPKLINGVI